MPIKMQPNVIMSRPVTQGVIRRPRPQSSYFSKPMLPKRIRICNHSRALSIMFTIYTLAGYIFSTTANVDTTLTGTDIVGSEIDAAFGGEELHKRRIILAPLYIVGGIGEGNGSNGGQE
jgi:hypothetical protein